MSKKVLVPFVDGFEEIEALTVIDLLDRAGVEVTKASITDSKEVTGSHKIKIVTDTILKSTNKDDYDLFFVPGGPGTSKLAECELVNEYCKFFANKDDKFLSAICAAPSLVLAPLGIIDGKKVTGYPAEQNVSKLTKSIYMKGAHVVRDGNVITGSGVAGAPMLGLELIRILSGDEVAAKVKNATLYDYF